MHQLKIPVIILTLLFSLFSCNSENADFSQKNETAYSDGMEYDLRDESEESRPQSKQSDQPMKKKLIVEGYISFESSHLDSTTHRIKTATEKHDAYIASEQQNNSYYQNRNLITIRVPSNTLAEFIADATKGVKKFDSKSITSRDVTMEFFDLSARITTKKELEERFLKILQKANSIKDILEIERELGSLRADIESLEGRLRYMSNKVDYSTITFEFYETIIVENENKYLAKLKQGFKNGWENLVFFLIAIVNLWPFIILLLGGGLFFIRRRKMKAKTFKE